MGSFPHGKPAGAKGCSFRGHDGVSRARRHFPTQDSHGTVVWCTPKPYSRLNVLQARRCDELTLEIPGSDHPGPGRTQAGERPVSPQPHGGKDDAALGKRAGTSSCRRDPAVTRQPLGSPSPCRAQAQGAERELRGLGMGEAEPSAHCGQAWRDGFCLVLLAWQKPSITPLPQNHQGPTAKEQLAKKIHIGPLRDACTDAG